MKRTLALTLILFCCLTPVFATALYDGLSFYELAALRDEIQAEMMRRSEWQEVTVPVGTYQIGVHIPAGHWLIQPVSGAYSYVDVGSLLDANGKDVNYRSPDYYHIALVSKTCRIYDPGDPSHVDLVLKDGMYLTIENAAVVFTPYSGQPDFGFSFK